MNYQSRETLLKHLEHLFNNSREDECIRFEVDVIALLCANAKELKEFRQNSSSYLKLLNHFLIEGIRRQKVGGSFEDLLKFSKITIIFKSIPFANGLYCKINDLTSDDIGKWVVVTGTVVQSIQSKTLEKSKQFECNDCQARYRRQNNYQNYYRFELPPFCKNVVDKQKSKSMFSRFYNNLNKRKEKESQRQDASLKMGKCRCTKYSPVEEKKICVDYQQIRLQEQFRHITAGRLPQTITAVIEGDLGQNWRAGDDVVVSGIFDYRFKKPAMDQKMQLQMVIVVNSILMQRSTISKDNYDRESLFEESQSSDRFPLNFYQEASMYSKDMILAKQLEYRNTVIRNFCPTIFGREIVKLGLILSLLGGVSIHNEQTRIRGQSHVLLIGEPGTGKSVLIKQVANLAERSFFINGIGTSSAGLSVSYYKDGADWTIQPGALVLADNGVCCIDELTLLAKKDENSLLEAMEQQTVSSAKASVIGKLNARTTVICACNPITPTQKYDTSLDLQTNTGLSIPLLTRFDLILILQDQNDRVEDSLKCDHILQKFSGEQYRHYEKKEQFSIKPLLKKCKLFQPELKGADFLSKYYIQERKNVQKVTTARAFESLCRLAEAHAKLMMKDATSEFDCLTAIMLTENVWISTLEEYYAYLEQFNKKYHVQLE